MERFCTVLQPNVKRDIQKKILSVTFVKLCHWKFILHVKIVNIGSLVIQVCKATFLYFPAMLLPRHQIFLTASRFVQSSSTLTAGRSNLAKLRKKTGYSISLCKKALDNNEQDLQKSIDWLKVHSS